MNVKMTNQEIKEKYGIEPIMKEMWVWDVSEKDAEIMFVSTKDSSDFYQYCCYNSKKHFASRKHASETNPNERELKVGDKGYFWDDADSYAYGDLKNFTTDFFQCNVTVWFQHFSYEKQPWMK